MGRFLIMVSEIFVQHGGDVLDYKGFSSFRKFKKMVLCHFFRRGSGRSMGFSEFIFYTFLDKKRLARY